MFFTLKEFVKWFGMTAFEIWVHLVVILIFSVLVVLKQEQIIDMSWWWAFCPLFVGGGVNTYFCIIVFIRQFYEGPLRQSILRMLSSLLCYSLLFVFQFLLCQKLEERVSDLSHSKVMAPLFPLLLILFIRSCQAQAH